MRRMSDGPVGEIPKSRPASIHAVPELDAAASVAQVDLVADPRRSTRCASPPRGSRPGPSPGTSSSAASGPRPRKAAAPPPSTSVPAPASATRPARGSPHRARSSARRPSRRAARRCPPAPARNDSRPGAAEPDRSRSPPSAAPIRTYLPCPTAHFDRSRGVSRLVNSNASGPVISTCRSTLTSHTVTPVSSFSYSAWRSS